MNAQWVALNDRTWALVDAIPFRVMFSFVVFMEGKFVLRNVGMSGGDYTTLRKAKDAAEDYWASQEVGPLAGVGKASAVSTGVGEAIAGPVPVTGTTQAIVGGVERQHRSRLKR